MPVTYDAIATTTLGSNANSVTFSNISQNYTDLVLVANTLNTTGQNGTSIRFNGDTGSNYSYTILATDGSNASSTRETNQSTLQTGLVNESNWSINIFNIQSYSNSAVFKQTINRAGISNLIRLVAGIWRNTAAITSITVIAAPNNYTFIAGSVFTIYGIKAA